MNRANERVLVFSAIALVILMGVSCYAALKKLERIAQVTERMDARLEHAMDAAAPVGHAAVEKGVQALNEVDAKELGKSATNGAKQIGAAAKERALELMKRTKKDNPDQE
ncbi:MAG: hypothetical protein JWN51_2759 [Phycisphaerales bacterium]|nr:hypothetical protein [Phycisphaerales bacterium]